MIKSAEFLTAIFSGTLKYKNILSDCAQKMNNEITVHPTAIVHKKAEIGSGVKIGPFSIIEEKVKIGSGTE
ncbi:MAG: hypothetical protein ACE5QV_01320, partial [Fidelibacterota bacterium]